MKIKMMQKYRIWKRKTKENWRWDILLEKVKKKTYGAEMKENWGRKEKKRIWE